MLADAPITFMIEGGPRRSPKAPRAPVDFWMMSASGSVHLDELVRAIMVMSSGATLPALAPTKMRLRCLA
jgi:hypothetical protein